MSHRDGQHIQRVPECEVMKNMSETVASHIGHMIKKSKGEEFQLVCELLAVVSVTFDTPLESNEDRDAPVIEYLNSLQRYLLVDSDNFKPESFEHAVKAATVLCLMNGVEISNVFSSVQGAASGHVADGARHAALMCWGVFAPFHPDRDLVMTAPELFLNRLLSHDDPETVVLAAELICMLSSFIDEENSPDETTEVLEDTQGIIVASTTSKSGPDWILNAISLLEELAHDSHKGTKDSRKRLRVALDYLTDGTLPNEKVSVGVLLVLDDWTEIILMSFFRSVLGEGLVEHLKYNASLHELFDLKSKDIGDHLIGGRMVDLERKAFGATAQKQAAKARSGERKKREAAKNVFINAEN